MTGLTSDKSATDLGLCAFGDSESTHRFVPLALNPGDAAAMTLTPT